MLENHTLPEQTFVEDRMYDFTKRLDELSSKPGSKQADVLREFHRELDVWDAERVAWPEGQLAVRGVGLSRDAVCVGWTVSLMDVVPPI